MQHDFEFKGAAELPYNPTDYGLPVWKDEDHQPPVETKQEAKADSMTAEDVKRKLCLWAEQQLGYHEGENNSNKYAETPGLAEMYGWNPQGQPWCDVFVDAGFISCFGVENACRMTHQPMGAGSALCKQSAQYYKDNGAFCQRPEVGDQVFFYASGDINHTGIVVRVVGGSIITVEGNSSDQVAERCYSTGDSKIAGYGRPNWAVVDGKDIDVPITPHVPEVADDPEPCYYELRFPYLQRGSAGESVTAVQIALLGRGYGIGPDGADGDFGGNTESAVKRFQSSNGLAPDGIVGPETGAALFGGEVYKPPKQETKAEAYEASSFWNSLLTKIKG